MVLFEISEERPTTLYFALNRPKQISVKAPEFFFKHSQQNTGMSSNKGSVFYGQNAECCG